MGEQDYGKHPKIRRMEPHEFEEFKSLSEDRYKLAEAIENIRKVNPKVVFLTQTSSIPYEFALKEAYKHAYPNEPQPKFLTLDVKPIRILKKDYETKEELTKKNYSTRRLWWIGFKGIFRRIDWQAKVKKLEKEIDQLVYKLYELTPNEIKIVEGFGK